MRDDHNSAWQVNAFGGCLYGGGAYRLNAAAWMRARAHIVWTPPTNRWYIWPTHLNVCMYARLIVIFRLVGVGAFYYHNQMKFWRLVFINRNAVWILKKRLMCTFEIRPEVARNSQMTSGSTVNACSARYVKMAQPFLLFHFLFLFWFANPSNAGMAYTKARVSWSVWGECCRRLSIWIIRISK